jgi:hypothetical protein
MSTYPPFLILPTVNACQRGGVTGVTPSPGTMLMSLIKLAKSNLPGAVLFEVF